jgi:hypothetical protein
MPAKPSICLVSPARNEGPYLLEWIAWHRVIGFDDIVVLTHDCTDGSDVLLDTLASHGFVRHRRHQPSDSESPLGSAYRRARQDPQVVAADWVMALDTDEFLQVFAGDGSIHDLMRLNGQHCLGMAINWKVFGNNEQTTWTDEFVRHQFTRVAEGQVRANMHYKSIFRELGNFARMASHTPRRYSGNWGGDNIWVDSEGVPLRAVRLVNEPKHSRAIAMRRITHVAAQVSHYAVKSVEGFALKGTRKSGAARIYRHDAEFFETYNRNEAEDLSALSREVAFAAEYAKLLAVPQVEHLHHACCANYVAQLCQHAGVTPETDARYLHHIALSQ